VRNKYQRKDRKSNHKFEIVRGQELLVAGAVADGRGMGGDASAGGRADRASRLQILRAILENEVTHRVGPPHRPHPTAGCVRWGKQSGYVVFAGQKIPLERPRVRNPRGPGSGAGELRSVAARRKAATSVQEAHGGGIVYTELSRAVKSVLEGYGIGKAA